MVLGEEPITCRPGELLLPRILKPSVPLEGVLPEPHQPGYHWLLPVSQSDGGLPCATGNPTATSAG